MNTHCAGPRMVGLAVLAGLMMGCGTHVPDTSRLPTAAFAGHLVTTASGTWFERCGAPADERAWWVTFTDGAVEQIARARASGIAAAGDRAFVRWRAAVTDERHVGPGGTALLVREILEVREPGPHDCAATDSSGRGG